MRIEKAVDLKKGDIIMVDIEERQGYFPNRVMVKKTMFGEVRGSGDKENFYVRLRFNNFKTKKTSRLQLYWDTDVKVLDEEEVALMNLRG